MTGGRGRVVLLLDVTTGLFNRRHFNHQLCAMRQGGAK